MALTPGRAIALALTACAGAVALLLPPQPRRLERGGPYLRTARDQVAREIEWTRRAILIRTLRDSARALAAHGNPREPATLFVGTWTPGEVAWLQARVADILGAEQRGSPTAVVLARDSTFRGYPALVFALPDSGSSACVALYAEGILAPGPWNRPPRHRRLAPALLGPCAYYAWFGRAGAAVEGWLRDGGAALALTSPSYPPPAWHPPPPPPWNLRWLRGEGSWLVEPRLGFSLALDACLAGRVSRCGEFVQSRRQSSRQLARLGIHEEFVWSIQADDAAFLSDVLTTFGPERFARFWGADGSMPAAFASAFDVPLNEWTRAWATERFGPARGHAAVGLGQLGWSAAAVLGFLGLTLLIVSRRRVSA
jgi:hypothetical protein